MTADSRERFSDRVADYIRYRPKYPAEVATSLLAEGIIFPGAKVADLGSGTGFLAELFLQAGCTVNGVEPNAAMRTAGEDYLAKYPNFHSVDGSAEATTLADRSVDVVTAGQAMHWFDRDRTRAEILRISRPPSWFVCVSNDRDLEASEFMQEYERLLQHLLPEYSKVRSRYHPMIDYLEDPEDYRIISLTYEQQFDEAGLIGRVLSSSYAPKEGPVHDKLINGLKDLFRRFTRDGQVRFNYRTNLEFGPLASS